MNYEKLNYEDLLKTPNNNSSSSKMINKTTMKTTTSTESTILPNSIIGHKKFFTQTNYTNSDKKTKCSSNKSNSSNKQIITKNTHKSDKPEPPFWIILLTYFGYLNLFLFGCLSDFLRSIGFEKKKGTIDSNPSVSLMSY